MKNQPQSPQQISLLDRYIGTLVGLAVGDSLGTPVQFMDPGTFEPVTSMRGGGEFETNPGEWSDDTSMALCLAESLIECNGFDAKDQMERYVRWYRDGYLSSKEQSFDIGINTQVSLSLFIKTGDPFSGKHDPEGAGNGSLMRLAPIALAFAQSPEQAIAYASEQSYTTHGSVEASDACRYFTAVLIGALRGKKKEEILLAFANGEIKRLITKAKMTGMGLNWQHCNHSVFFPTWSYEQYYQAIRRFWRFGQKNKVTIDMVISDGQERVLEALEQKTQKALKAALTEELNLIMRVQA
jgi:ADP-ribosylglycohydrolase